MIVRSAPQRAGYPLAAAGAATPAKATLVLSRPLLAARLSRLPATARNWRTVLALAEMAAPA